MKKLKSERFANLSKALAEGGKPPQKKRRGKPAVKPALKPAY